MNGHGTQRSLGGLESRHQADIVFRDKDGDNLEDREDDRDRDTFVAEPSSIFNRYILLKCPMFVLTLFL